MNITVMAFAAMAAVTILFGAATMARELKFQLPARRQTGDSSLGRHSVNWLAATAFIAALVICFVLR